MARCACGSCSAAGAQSGVAADEQPDLAEGDRATRYQHLRVPFPLQRDTGRDAHGRVRVRGPGSTTDAASMSAYSAEDVDYDSLPCFGFHQDSGLQADTEYRPAPRFSLKAGAPSSHSKRVATLRYPDQLGLFRLLFHGRRQTRHGQHVDCPRPGKRLHYKPLSSPTKWLTWCTIGLCPRAADDG